MEEKETRQKPHTLSPRLALCAQLARPGKTVVDVGTDHAYLPIWMLLSGRISRAVACDINPGPLRCAALHAQRWGVEDRLELVRSDGLEALGPEAGEEIVIAGMGGELILKIIRRAPWLQDPEKHLVLQPMSHPGRLRVGINALGFRVLEEQAVVDNGKVYSAFSADYAGGPQPENELYPYMGRLAPGGPNVDLYAQKVIQRLQKQAMGAACQGRQETQEALEKVIREIASVYLA